MSVLSTPLLAFGSGGLSPPSHTITGDQANLARSSRTRPELGKGSVFTTSTMLDVKAEAADVVILDTWSAQPVDRGPAPAAVPDRAASARLLRSWQYTATGKLAAARVLEELNALHIKTGGPVGVQAEAERYIREHEASDQSFYVINLANVNRLLRGGPPPAT